MEDNKLATEQERKKYEEIARKMSGPLLEIQKAIGDQNLEGAVYISKNANLSLDFFHSGWRANIDKDGNAYLFYEFQTKI